MRGRRLALLLTGLWPLLAKDDVPAMETNETVDDETNVELLQHPHHSKLPLVLTMNAASTLSPGNIVMADFELEEEKVVEKNNDRIPTHDENRAVRDSQEFEAKQEAEPTSDSGEAKESERESETAPQEASEPDASETSNMQVPDAATNDHVTAASVSPTLDNVQQAEEKEAASSNETTQQKPDVAESTDMQSLDDDERKATQVPIMEEEEDASTDRVLVDYASKSAGALILEKAPAMKGTSNLLNEDNDKYAIAPCSEKKFVVIGLSEDILVKQVKLANYERYSSHLKDFQLMGSQTMGEWVDLGTYTAEPGNEEQAFDLIEPAWARYMKFKFLTHHGSEHYCTLSQIKVHGSTMLQGFHEQWDSQEDLEEVEDSSEGTAVKTESADDTQGEASDESKDSTQEGEGSSPEAETKLPKEQGTTDESSRGMHKGDSESATESDSKKNGVAVNADNNAPANATPRYSAEDSQATEKGVSETESGDADGKVSTDKNPPSCTDSAVRSIIETEPDSQRTGSNVPVDQGSPSALSCASIGTSSHDAVNAGCAGSMKQLDTSAIKPREKTLRTVIAEVVETLVTAEAFMSVMDAEGVSDEVKEIQQKLKTAGTGVPRIRGNTEIPSISDSNSETVEPVPDDQPDRADDSADPAVETEITTNEESQVVEPEASSVDKTPSDTTDDVKSSQSSSVKKGETEGSVPVRNEEKHKDSNQTNTKTVERAETSEKSRLVDLDPALAKIIGRFPSAACMNGLDYQDFKAKLVVGRKDRVNAQGGSTSGNAGKMEPIFKTLTDEIKSLQISQSVQDQYMKALISCYQQVMIEMAETLSDVETRQEQRLVGLEEAMDAMRSSNFKKLLAVLVTVMSTCFAGAELLYKALVASRETILIDMPGSLVFLGVSLSFLLVLYCFASRHKDLEQRHRVDVANTKTDEVETSMLFDYQTTVIDEAPTTTVMSPISPDVEQSESESESSDPDAIRAISLLSKSEKLPEVQIGPTLVPLEKETKVV